MRYTYEQLEFLRDSYLTWPIPVLTDKFNTRYHQHRTQHAIKSCLNNHNFVCGRKPGQLRSTITLMTWPQADWLREQYNLISVADVTALFNAKFGTDLTIQQIKSFVDNHGMASGLTGCFPKGNKPWNTGTKGVMKPNSGNFKKGSIPPNRKPLGHERICSKDRYILIKIAETNPYTGAPTRYKAKHIVEWEEHHGPVPHGHIITFVDDIKLNCDIDNLECISKAENVRRNKMQYLKHAPELRPTIKALAKLVTHAHERGREDVR